MGALQCFFIALLLVDALAGKKFYFEVLELGKDKSKVLFLFVLISGGARLEGVCKCWARYLQYLSLSTYQVNGMIVSIILLNIQLSPDLTDSFHGLLWVRVHFCRNGPG